MAVSLYRNRIWEEVAITKVGPVLSLSLLNFGPVNKRATHKQASIVT